MALANGVHTASRRCDAYGSIWHVSVMAALPLTGPGVRDALQARTLRCYTDKAIKSRHVAVLPRLELAAVDVVVAHASAKSYAAEAAKTAGWTAAKAERTMRTRFRKDVPDHAAFRFVPFAVETCGYMGKEAVKFVNRLGDIAAETGRIPKGAFWRWAVQLLSVTVQRGDAEMYRRSGLVISREQGLRYDAGFAVPVLMS